MMKYLIIAIALAALYFYIAKPAQERYFLEHPDVSLEKAPDQLEKCITSEGKVIYGSPPIGVTCKVKKRVEGNLTILHDPESKDVQNPKQEKVKENSPKFVCDGRTKCSQMNSIEEAKFFINNCPNTQMDGDNDKIPCENDSRF